MLICCLHLTVRTTVSPQSHLHRLANSSSSHSLIIIFVSLMLTQTWMSLLLSYWMVPDLRLHFQRMDLQSYLPVWITHSCCGIPTTRKQWENRCGDITTPSQQSHSHMDVALFQLPLMVT